MTDTKRLVATGGNLRGVFHTDPDCQSLSGSETRPVRPVEVQNKQLDECTHCCGESYRNGPAQTCPRCDNPVPSLPRHLRQGCNGGADDD